MKTMLKKYIVLFAAFLLISGCSNPFEPIQVEDSSSKTGSFSLAVNGISAGRTIMPVIDITSPAAYTLTFFKGTTVDDQPVIENRTPENLSDPTWLDAGTWNLLVTAYEDAERTKPLAQGSLMGIEIVPLGTASDSVTLSQITTTGGSGTFSWDIEYPDYPYSVSPAKMVITRINGNSEIPVQELFFVGGTYDNVIGKIGSLDLEAGYYRVVFTLTLYSSNLSVEWREILHIYDGKESSFSHEFTVSQFTNTIYTVTFNSGSSGSLVPSQSVNKNTPVTRPANPTRTGYNFTGWYTNSTATARYDFNTPVTGNITLYAGWYQAGEEGIYVGIIKFANTAEQLTSSGPVLLNSTTSRNTLTSALTTNYSRATAAGTSMFYAVHKALENLKANEFGYPTNLDSVNVITFTGGLDSISDGLSLQPGYTIEGESFNTPDEYANYIKGEIANRTIAGKPVTAYSVGVLGNYNTASFQSNLEAIASPGKAGLTDFSAVQSTFGNIAEGLSITSTRTDFTMFTTLLTNGSRVRMTFDVTGTNPASMAVSQRYIEGTISRSGNVYTLTNIIYGGGISSDAGIGPLNGTVSGTQLEFVFNNITIFDSGTEETISYSPQANQTKQWYTTGASSTWNYNDAESVSASSSTTTVERRSAIIYLVLDCSRSLTESQIGDIKTAAINFINSIYNRYNGVATQPEPPVTETSRQITVAMWDSLNDGWDNSAALRISVNGTYLSTNARINSGGSPGYYTFTANMGDTVSFSWLNGGQYDRECAYAVYYSDAPPNPMFNPSTGSSDSRVLLSKSYNNPSGAVGSGTSRGSFTVTGGGNDITYAAASNSTSNTTAINLTFNTPVSGLTASDITVAGGTGSVTKGTLSGSGTSWSLDVAVVTAGSVTVSINKGGIESGTKPVTVYKDASATRDITVAMWDSRSDGWDTSAALRIKVNGTYRSTNARLTSGGGPSYYNFTANVGDTVLFEWYSGGTYDYECAFAVYYTNDPPSPAFNPSSGTTGGKVLVSKRYNSPSGAVGSGTSMGSFTVR